MEVRKQFHLPRRTIAIYVVTIVIPACVLLYLGITTFRQQSRNLAALRAEKLASDLKEKSFAAAEAVFSGQTHPIAQYSFVIDNGLVIQPALRAPVARSLPTEFTVAQHLEDTRRFEDALTAYRRLYDSSPSKGLALSGIARSLKNLSHADEAKAAWRELASKYPDELNLSGRPFGIIAAIEAGDREGLYDRIIAGRWDLPGDYAAYVIEELNPGAKPAYLDRYQFAEELQERFSPQPGLRENLVYESPEFSGRRVFYRTDSSGRISGFSVNLDWVNHTLLPELQAKLSANAGGRPELIYGAGIGLVMLIVSAGVILLLRDVSREARINRLRSDFVSSVSHELKTPITLIRLYSETLLRHAAISADERSEFHRIIVRESERLTRLIEQVLTFSRVERGVQKYNLEAGDLSPVISGVVDDYKEFIERSGFSLTRTIAESTPPVRFDPAALTQAIVNLLDNAVKYSAHSRDIAVRLDVNGENVTVEVEDHGVGIPSAEHQRIFERFYRAQNDNGKGGSGLGLFMVRHVMDAHGGRAEVDSEPGRGSRFRLILPVVSNG
jgi:signal transduction histidine kinase